ncbi:MAG: hypothetical protein AVDCRST_MAG54-124, partial [uncultured Actinomycetospora sp.]
VLRLRDPPDRGAAGDGGADLRELPAHGRERRAEDGHEVHAVLRPALPGPDAVRHPVHGVRLPAGDRQGPGRAAAAGAAGGRRDERARRAGPVPGHPGL